MPELNVQGADGSRRLLTLEKERITIGRSRDNDVFLPDQWLSRVHAKEASHLALVELDDEPPAVGCVAADV